MDSAIYRERFTSISGQVDADIDLIEAALLIAAENDHVPDTEQYQDLIRNLALKYETHYDSSLALGVSVSSLADFIHKDEGFGGNIKDYYAPENSYLNRVLDTRRGIPITLALIHIGIGRELDLAVGGINFPGHFLVRYGHDKHLIVDPFTGRILSEADCTNLLKQITGGRIKLQKRHFEFASNKDILVRILDNLKQIFWRHKSWNESKACIERQLLLTPGSEELILQLGAVNEMQGKFLSAQLNYSRVLESCPQEHIRDAASQRLLALTPRSPITH